MWIKAKNTINDGKDHLPGSVFEIDDKSGKRLVKMGAAEKADAPETEEKKETVSPKLSAEDAIAKINECKTIEEVKAFFKGEERVTVVNAARTKIKALNDEEKKK